MIFRFVKFAGILSCRFCVVKSGSVLTLFLKAEKFNFAGRHNILSRFCSQSIPNTFSLWFASRLMLSSWLEITHFFMMKLPVLRSTVSTLSIKSSTYDDSFTTLASLGNSTSAISAVLYNATVTIASLRQSPMLTAVMQKTRVLLSYSYCAIKNGDIADRTNLSSRNYTFWLYHQNFE